MEATYGSALQVRFTLKLTTGITSPIIACQTSTDYSWITLWYWPLLPSHGMYIIRCLLQTFLRRALILPRAHSLFCSCRPLNFDQTILVHLCWRANRRHLYIYIYYLLQMGFSPVAVEQQVHNRHVTHITRSNNTFSQTQYTKNNIKGHPTTMNTKQIRQ
jgi:hypothetical protein